MAAKRVARTAVDWVALAERVPANQKDAFRIFKQKCDNFAGRVFRFPEAAPALNFAEYRAKLGNKALVDSFEKEYAALKVPYPTDKQNLVGEVDSQAKKALQDLETFKADQLRRTEEARTLLAKIKTIPPMEEMTVEMFNDYFPDNAQDPVKKPTFYPHTKIHQPQHDPNTLG